MSKMQYIVYIVQYSINIQENANQKTTQKSPMCITFSDQWKTVWISTLRN